MKKLKLFTSVFLLSTFGFFACGDDDENQNALELEKPGKIAGMGKQPGVPTGTPLELPSWFKIEEMIGMDGIDFMERKNEACFIGGSGEYVIVNLKYRSTYPRDTVIVIPAGTIVEYAGLVIPGDIQSFQHGCFIDRIVVPVKSERTSPGGCRVNLFAYCINNDKNPSENFVKYKFGNVTNSPLFQQFLDLVKNKDVAITGLDQKEEDLEKIQRIIYDLTEEDGDGLTQQNRAILASLPNK